MPIDLVFNNRPIIFASADWSIGHPAEGKKGSEKNTTYLSQTAPLSVEPGDQWPAESGAAGRTLCLMTNLGIIVIPAQAGIQEYRHHQPFRIPACAGMTLVLGQSKWHSDQRTYNFKD
ncbi:MAG: hypothetical protein DBO99_03465 [gamma proteobacterium symbiont of Ctena orbiculata]|nr:MAG: hypothetical protein DBO99_03465 [gamma proteobacterium symbiont of Ctena orbiculata]